MNKTPIFTPNVEQGGAGGVRYFLYRHGAGLFSITPKGKRFRASYEADDCGAGCRCAAFITHASNAGRALLAKATRIDNFSKPIK